MAADGDNGAAQIEWRLRRLPSGREPRPVAAVERRHRLSPNTQRWIVAGITSYEAYAPSAKKDQKKQEANLKDRLSRLTYIKAVKLLGAEGPQLIRQGATYDNIDIDRNVYFRGDLFRLNQDIFQENILSSPCNRHKFADGADNLA